MWLENAHSLMSRLLLKTSHSPATYRYISVAVTELYNGGRTVEGRGLRRGLCPLTRKKLNFHQKMVGILVHSKMTFYVYAKIGQVNGGHSPLPLGSTIAIFQKWLKIDGYMLRGV